MPMSRDGALNRQRRVPRRTPRAVPGCASHFGKKPGDRVANRLMGAPQSYALEGNRARIVRWRAARLERAGFNASLALRVACDPGSDIHGLLELVDRGCPPQLAVRILAPLDDGKDGSR